MVEVHTLWGERGEGCYSMSSQEGEGDIDDISGHLAFGRFHGRDDTKSCMPCGYHGFFNELEGEIDLINFHATENALPWALNSVAPLSNGYVLV